MRNLERRIERIETLVNEEESLTEADFELILSCLPGEVVDAVKKALFTTDKRGQAAGIYNSTRSASKQKSGLHGKTLERIVSGLHPDHAAALKAKLAARGI